MNLKPPPPNFLIDEHRVEPSAEFIFERQQFSRKYLNPLSEIDYRVDREDSAERMNPWT
jgi:hypothetical protein